MSDEPPLDVSNTDDAQAAPQSPEVRRGSLAMGPLTGLCLGLAAGVVAWAVLQRAYPAFVIPDELGGLPPTAPAEKLMEKEAAQKKADFSNHVFALGLFGALVAGGLALGEGACRRSLPTALVAGVACGAGGAVFGCLAGALGHFMFLQFKPLAQLEPLAKTIVAQAAMLATLAGGAGLVVGLLVKRWVGPVVCLMAGALVGVLTGMFYPMLVAVLWPNAATEVVVPVDAGTQLLWIGLTSGLLGLAIPRSAGKGPPRRGRHSPAAPPAT